MLEHHSIHTSQASSVAQIQLQQPLMKKKKIKNRLFGFGRKLSQQLGLSKPVFGQHQNVD
jgi:hypothetical protein